MNLRAPESLSPDHQVSSFACGESTLDEWLKRRALGNQTSGASRTFVVTTPEREVMGYYALAVDARAQGMKLGAALLQDALQRCLLVSQNTGVRAMLVHALNDRARQFYEYYGFKASPAHPMTLMLRINQSSI